MSRTTYAYVTTACTCAHLITGIRMHMLLHAFIFMFMLSCLCACDKNNFHNNFAFFKRKKRRGGGWIWGFPCLPFFAKIWLRRCTHTSITGQPVPTTSHVRLSATYVRPNLCHSCWLETPTHTYVSPPLRVLRRILQA